MTNLSVYDAMLPAFRGFFKADPYQILDTVFDREYFPVAAAARSPVVDVREKDGKYLIEAELPGVSEKDLKLELKNGLLTLSTEKKEESKEKDDSGQWIRRERRESFFSRSFELPHRPAVPTSRCPLLCCPLLCFSRSLSRPKSRRATRRRGSRRRAGRRRPADSGRAAG